MLGLGFGFVEVGTLTPLPQAGNPRPRLFRLAEDRAIINRLGFNNRGQADALERLARRDRSRGIVGVNIGANKDSADRIADYVAGVRVMSPVADYLTDQHQLAQHAGPPRNCRTRARLRALLSAVGEARTVGGPPIFLKVAPDLGEGEPDQIVRVAHAARHRRPDRRQHHRSPRPPLRSAPRRGDRWTVRRAAEARSRSTLCAASARRAAAPSR